MLAKLGIEKFYKTAEKTPALEAFKLKMLYAKKGESDE